MPGKGKVEERGYAENEHTCAEFGETTCDVYLNGVAYWRNVPKRVWDYIIGGYQVIKKWLSYREEKVLGRSLMRITKGLYPEPRHSNLAKVNNLRKVLILFTEILHAPATSL